MIWQPRPYTHSTTPVAITHQELHVEVVLKKNYHRTHPAERRAFIPSSFPRMPGFPALPLVCQLPSAAHPAVSLVHSKLTAFYVLKQDLLTFNVTPRQ